MVDQQLTRRETLKRGLVAASLLAHEGISRLFNVVGGMTAYRALETR